MLGRRATRVPHAAVKNGESRALTENVDDPPECGAALLTWEHTASPGRVGMDRIAGTSLTMAVDRNVNRVGAVSGSGRSDVNSETQFVGGPPGDRTNVCRGAEPQFAAVREPGREGLAHQQPAAVSGSHYGGFIQQRSGVEHLENLRVRPADDRQISA